MGAVCPLSDTAGGRANAPPQGGVWFGPCLSPFRSISVYSSSRQSPWLSAPSVSAREEIIKTPPPPENKKMHFGCFILRVRMRYFLSADVLKCYIFLTGTRDLTLQRLPHQLTAYFVHCTGVRLGFVLLTRHYDCYEYLS